MHTCTIYMQTTAWQISLICVHVHCTAINNQVNNIHSLPSGPCIQWGGGGGGGGCNCTRLHPPGYGPATRYPHAHAPLGSPTHGRWPAYGTGTLCHMCACIPLEVQYHLQLRSHSCHHSPKPRPLRQKVITKQGWELSYWGVNAVNQCYDNTPLKRPTPHPCWGLLLTP